MIKNLEPIKANADFFSEQWTALFMSYAGDRERALKEVGSTDHNVIKLFVTTEVENLKKFEFFRSEDFLAARSATNGNIIQLIVWPLSDQAEAISWSELQEIKNQLVGEDHEGVELFPCEERNFHKDRPERMLWVCSDKAFRFQFGYFKPQISYARLEEVAQTAG